MIKSISRFNKSLPVKRIILLIFFLYSSLISFSCECPSLPRLNMDYCNKYEFIFKGTILSVGKCKEINKARFKLNELYKGISPEEIDVYFDCSSDCAVNFNVGEQWIIYSNYAQMGKPKVDFCSRNRKYILNENKIQTEYVNTDISFDQEQAFLLSNFGKHHFLRTNNNTELSHQNIKPDKLTSIFLILVSIAGFVVFYYLFNKFIK